MKNLSSVTAGSIFGAKCDSNYLLANHSKQCCLVQIRAFQRKHSSFSMFFHCNTMFKTTITKIMNSAQKVFVEIPNFLKSLARSLNIFLVYSSVADPISILRAPVAGYVLRISATIATQGSPSTTATSNISSNSVFH